MFFLPGKVIFLYLFTEVDLKATAFFVFFFVHVTLISHPFKKFDHICPSARLSCYLPLSQNCGDSQH